MICVRENCSSEAFFLYHCVLGADDNEDDDNAHDDDDDDNDEEDDDEDDDDDCDLKSVKLFTPQHCCEDISRSQETLTCIIIISIIINMIIIIIFFCHHHHRPCCNCHSLHLWVSPLCKKKVKT